MKDLIKNKSITSVLKSFVILLVAIVAMTSCNSNSGGCGDPNALNHEAGGKSDGQCTYTKVIFYAKSNKVGGSANVISKIEVNKIIVDEEELIGTIIEPGEDNPAPSGCVAPEGAVTYEFTYGNETTRFKARYYYENGTNETGDTYEFSPDKSKECITQNLTL